MAVCTAATVVVCVVLRVHVINESGVPDQTMSRVAKDVERYFHGAGIALDWDGDHDSRLTIALTSATRMREMDSEQPGVLGLAVSGSRRAYVFIDRIQAYVLETFKRAAAARFDRRDMLNRIASETTLIALVIAHEIGHVLLSAGAHAPGGVMSKDFTLECFRRALDRTLVFSPDQNRAMRAALTSEPSAAYRTH
jgi:hypothetical protein